MPVRQTGDWGGKASQSIVLLDAFDIHPMAGMAHSGSNDANAGAFRRFYAAGNSGNTVSGVERTLFNFPGGAIANAFDPNQQRFGPNNLQRALLQNFASIPALQVPAGFDPSTISGLGGTPGWWKYTLAMTIKKAAAGPNDDTLFGLSAEGGLGPWATGANTSVPMVMLHSPANTTEWTQVALRTNTNFFTGPTFSPIAPVDAMQFRRVRMEVTSGPVFGVKFFIDDVMVSDLKGPDFAWSMATQQRGELTMLGYIRPAKDQVTNSGIEGPYNTRLTIEVIP